MQNDWNSIAVRGAIEEEPQIYCYDGKKHTTNYLIKLSVENNKGELTSIPVILPSNIDNIEEYTVGRKIFVKGTIITHRVNVDEETNKGILKSIVSARVVDFLKKDLKPLNSVIITGYLVSKEPLGQSKKGKDSIVYLVASNREDESSYIRCLAVFERAHVIDQKEIGSRVEIHGYIYQNENRKDYVVRTTWIKGFDKPYHNKSGYFFGEKEEGAN